MATAEINVTCLEDICLTRIADDTVQINWHRWAKNQRVAIFLGTSPEKIDRHQPAAQATKKSSATISGLNPSVRYYFEVTPDHGPKRMISERRVPLKGSVNFRDLGGYKTADGRRVKWGRVFRSDNLARLTDGDVVFLQRMGIRLICDFRTPAEVKKMPDRVPSPGVAEYLHLPIRYGQYDPADTFERIKKGDIDWMTESYMVGSYIKNIEHSASVWTTFFRRLASASSLPVVFHCTGGKDRAGVGAALVLLALGVADETVIEDHGLSNIYIAGVLKKISAELRDIGVAMEKVAPYFTAPRAAITALLAHIRQTYGSAAGYLEKKARIGPNIIARLKTDLLE